MKRYALLLIILCCLLCSCSDKKTFITKKLPEEKTTVENKKNQDHKDPKIKIYQNTYHTYVSDNSNGGLSIFSPMDKNKLLMYCYDEKDKKYRFETIDYRYNFYEPYAELSSEHVKVVDSSMSPDGINVIIVEKGAKDTRIYSVYNPVNGAKSELLTVEERYLKGNPVYQLQFEWSKDGKFLVYGIQLSSTSIASPGYYGNSEQFGRVVIRDMIKGQDISSFQRYNLKNDGVLFNYKLGISSDGKRVVVYNNTFLGNSGNNKISLVDARKPDATLLNNYANTNAYNSNVIYQDNKLYRINEDHTLSVLETLKSGGEWERILYREVNVVGYLPLKGGKQFVVVEDAKGTPAEPNTSAEYNIYLCDRYTYTRKLLYKSSNPFLSITLNEKENVVLLESMMPYNNIESYVEEDSVTTVIAY